MENIGDEYKHYWETNMFFQTQELDSWGLDEALSAYYDSSSPDGAASSGVSSKNIVSERNRRKKLNERLFALRAVVPNISKMDKASIIKDAIEYIQLLHEQEKVIQAEIMELESGMPNNINQSYDFDQELPMLLRSKKKRTDQLYDSVGSRNFPIEVLEVNWPTLSILIISFSSNRENILASFFMFIQPIKYQIRLIHYFFFVNNQPPTTNIDIKEEIVRHHLSLVLLMLKI